MNRVSLVFLLSFSLFACDEGGNAASAPSAKPTATAGASGTAKAAPSGSISTAAASDAQLDKEDIPVAADFEDEAEKSIDEDNVDDEVAKLEKEIGDDKD